jgi:cation diffusion facilitator CzcD-associated flavoprotein CzcO
VNVIVIGSVAPADLGLSACTVLTDVTSTHFDSTTETWTVTGPDGRHARAAMVVDARPSADPAVAGHGHPNYFRIPGPDRVRQTRFVARCLRMAERSGAARVEARKHRIVLRRWRPRPLASQFYLTGAQPAEELYDGPATVTLGGQDISTRVRLTGHLDAIDGRYHWQGTVFDELPGDARARSSGLTLTIDGRTAGARVVETTPWGTHMVAGVGTPPFEP